MTTIDTTTASTATAYSNQRKLARTSTGRLWGAFYNGSGVELWYSDDDGVTWTQNTSATLSGVINPSLFIDVDDHAHIAYQVAAGNAVEYRRMGSIGVSTSWGSAVSLDASGVGNYPDLVVHREGSGWKAHVVWSTSAAYVYYLRVGITSGGVASADTSKTIIGGSYSTSTHTWPSLDFNHTGDGKTIAGSTPHLFAAWSAGGTGAGKGIRFRKATYSAGTWTWGTEREIDSTRYVLDESWWLNCLFDGTRVVLVGALREGSNNDIVAYDRDAADTTTTTRVLVDNAANAAMAWDGSASYDGDGNLWVLGRYNDGAQKLAYRKWTRATTTLGALTDIDTTNISAGPYVSVKRGYSNNRIEFIYTDGTASPYSVTYGSISLGNIKYWDGSAWTLKTLKYWDGSAWQTATLKRWDGSSWTQV